MLGNQDQSSGSDVGIRFEIEGMPKPAPKASGGPPRVFVLGVAVTLTQIGWAAGQTRNEADPSSQPWRWRRVDRDTVAHAMRAFNVRFDKELTDIGLPGIDPLQVRLEIGDIEDLNPDRFLKKIPVTSELLDLRTAIAGNGNALQAIERLKRQFLPDEAPETPATTTASGTGSTTGQSASLLDAIVTGNPTIPPPGTVPPARPDTPLGRTIDRILEGKTDPLRATERAHWIARVDQILSAVTRAVLHDPDFQRIESNWRAVEWLANALPEEGIQFRLLDCSKEILVEDLRRSGRIGDSAFLQALTRDETGTPAAHPLSLLITDFTFGETAADATLLQIVSAIAAAIGTGVLAGVAPGLVGLSSFSELGQVHRLHGKCIEIEQPEWESMTRRPEARFIGLAFPRLLIRLPYGARGLSLDAFPFEELDPVPNHDHFLWAPPGFAYGCGLAGKLFREETDAQILTGPAQIFGLPFYVFDRDGELFVQPCAESTMTEELFISLQEQGFMPVASVRGTDRIIVGSLRSIAGTQLT
jgi:type VI secretion system protein ImpC